MLGFYWLLWVAFAGVGGRCLFVLRVWWVAGIGCWCFRVVGLLFVLGCVLYLIVCLVNSVVHGALGGLRAVIVWCLILAALS